MRKRPFDRTVVIPAAFIDDNGGPRRDYLIISEKYRVSRCLIGCVAPDTNHPVPWLRPGCFTQRRHLRIAGQLRLPKLLEGGDIE
jgi:hypothetical protein